MRTEDRIYLDGRWVRPSGEETFTLRDPATEEPTARIHFASARDAELAVQAARRAFDGWASLPVEERLTVLERWHETYRRRAEEIAQLTTAELGAPITFARENLTSSSGDVIASTVGVARTFDFEQRNGTSIIRREAYGVASCISPWNNPMFLSLNKLAPALAAGCTVVHKPAELTSGCGLLLAELADEAGFPPGVYNTVVGRGEALGVVLDGHPGVDLVDFTGSTRGGVQVAATAAATVKKTTLELGGKSANVILDDAALAEVVPLGVRACMSNSGQFCGAWTRMLIPRAHAAEAYELAAATAHELRAGDPRDESTHLGPVIDSKQYETILGYIHAGIQAGAKLLAGGPARPAGLTRGYYVQPTVFGEVDNSMAIAQEEIFGPVLSIIAYEDDADAVRIANDSDYGLRGAVFSADEERALAVARRLRTGQVDVNGYKMNPTSPFGGYKRSGHGRSQGLFGLLEFLQVKSIQL